MSQEIEFEESSGNIFADLGLPHPEERLAKAELAIEIGKILKKKNFTQAKAAEVLGISQPNVSALLHGRLRSFSLERLLRFLNDLGQNVKISITPAETPSNKGFTTIASSSPRTVSTQRVTRVGR
jgi:predicted XRE-type DNA-binding protein